MKEIKRYKITSANGNSSNVTKCDDGHWVNYADVKQLQARIKELESERDSAFENGKKVFKQLQAKENQCRELESQSHINEIKASAICEALNEDMEFTTNNPQPRNFEYGMTLIRLNSTAEKLRTKHD